MDRFVERHFQKLILSKRQSEYDNSPWLADALTFLIKNIESFPDVNSYFDSHLYSEIIEWMRHSNSSQPKWLADSLELLVVNIDNFPQTSEEDTYIVEYIYPH